MTCDYLLCYLGGWKVDWKVTETENLLQHSVSLRFFAAKMITHHFRPAALVLMCFNLTFDPVECVFVKRMCCIVAGRSLGGGGGQVCRPHFHTPLHPWLESKALGGSWGGGFQQDAAGDKPLSPAQHPHPHPLFSFPPTPPKDSTPDSVAAAALGQQDYQAAVAHATAMSVAFMQQQQDLPLCGDVKPMMGAPPSKQREGAAGDGCPQEASQPSGEYNAQYNAGGDYYGYQGKGFSGSQQQSKPRPNKTRTSAGESAPPPALAALTRPPTPLPCVFHKTEILALTRYVIVRRIDQLSLDKLNQSVAKSNISSAVSRLVNLQVYETAAAATLVIRISQWIVPATIAIY